MIKLFRPSRERLRAQIFFCVLAASWFPCALLGQSTVQWKTNYYTVTGASIAEIHQSFRSARPWKDKSALDGLTEWRIEWRFQLASSATDCRCNSFTTKTTITMTLPRWTRPTNAPLDVVTNWNRYVTALGQHELGHAQIGLAAAAEQHRRIHALSAEADCEALKKRINDLAERIVEDHRRRDREYDERTEHGVKQGAFLSDPRGRER